MKHISIFLAALLLSLALTACGDSRQNSGQQDPSHKAETTQPTEETPSGGDSSSKDSILSPSDDITRFLRLQGRGSGGNADGKGRRFRGSDAAQRPGPGL